MRKRIFVSGVLPLLCTTVFAQVIPQEGLVAYYKFDEPDAPLVTDYGPNGFHGEVAGIGIWDVGVVGQAMLFDGVGTYVNCGNDPLFDMTANGAITLMAWVHPFDAGNGEHNEWITKGDHAWALKQHSSSNMSEFFVYDPTQIGLGGNNWHVVRGVVMDSADYNGTWTHFAGTYDGVNLKIFHNGNLDSTVASSPVFNVRAEPVHLGHNAERTDRYFNGFLDEVIIWNVALSDEQIKAIYESYPGVSAVKQSFEPTGFSLSQNYPNPFNPGTQISYVLPKAAPVALKVYDFLGNEVRTLIYGMQTAGDHSVRFDSGDLASGVYFYKLWVGTKFVETKRMMLVH